MQRNVDYYFVVLSWCLAKRFALIDIAAQNGLGGGAVRIDARAIDARTNIDGSNSLVVRIVIRALSIVATIALQLARRVRRLELDASSDVAERR